MKDKGKIKARIGLTNLCAMLLVFAIMAYNMAGLYRSTIDKKLGTVSVQMISSGNVEDSYAHKSDFSTSAEVVNAHIQGAIRIQEEGTVLLKNKDGALPLSSNGDIKVTFFGMRSAYPSYSGDIGASTDESQEVTWADAFNESGFSVNPEMVTFYQNLPEEFIPARAAGGSSVVTETGYTVNEPGFLEYLNAPVDSFADYADAAIIVFGRPSGESSTYYPGEAGIGDPNEYEDGEDIFFLSKDEKYVVDYVKQQGVFNKIIILLNSSNVFSIKDLQEDDEVDAILHTGQIGCYGAYGVANLLNAATGKNPSAGVVDTFAVNNSLAPAAINYGVHTWTNYQDIDDSSGFELRAAWFNVQNEGIYEGYRYYETRYYDSIVNPASNAASAVGTNGTEWKYENEVLYPFGYGLSYTTFTEEILLEKSNIDVDGTSEIVVKVTNTGDFAGKDNVQLYIALPYELGQVEKSAIQLVGYGKTGEAAETSYFDPIYLQPGESEEIVITVERDYYASYDENEGNGAYILDAGDYYFAVGNGAHDALQNVMQAQGHLNGDTSATAVCVNLAEKVVIDQSAAGVEISNQLQDMDINEWVPNTTVTLSRSDWEGTFPKEIDVLTASEDMIYLLKNDYYTMKTGEDTSDFQFGTKGSSNGYTLGYLKGATDYNDERFAQIISNIPLETLLERVANGYDAVYNFEEIGAPHYDRVDAPSGFLIPLGQKSYGIYELDESDPNYNYRLNVFPSEPVVAASFSHKIPEMEGNIFGNDAIWTHVTTNYFPAMNIHRSVFNGRNNEYYSEDPILTGYMASDVVKATYAKGLASTVKHFAFNDSEVNREGVATFIDEQSARENELRGFQIAFEQGKARSVMTSFNRAGLIFASAQRGLITGILRNEWAFQGFVLTDSVKSVYYSQWEESIIAGTDTMLNHSPWNRDGKAWETCQVKWVIEDREMMTHIYDSIHHFLWAFGNSIWLNGVDAATSVERVYPWWEVATLLVICGTAVGAGVFGTWTVMDIRKSRNRKKGET